MKRIIFLLLGACLCACGRYGCGVPAGYEPLLDAALAGCPRADSLRQLLRQTPREQREGMAFLIAHMPRGDRDTMRLDLLRENVEYAYRARREYPWTRALPDSVFLNEVLPYAAVDEVRDSWRADFYPRFARRVALCRDIRAAIDSVNRNIAADVGVEYNTAREKTNQSPAESMRQDSRVARRPRQPQLGRGMDRRPLVFHGILPLGARPCLVPFGCRAGARRPYARHLRRVVPADRRLVSDGVERGLA